MQARFHHGLELLASEAGISILREGDHPASERIPAYCCRLDRCSPAGASLGSLAGLLAFKLCALLQVSVSARVVRRHADTATRLGDCVWPIEDTHAQLRIFTVRLRVQSNNDADHLLLHTHAPNSSIYILEYVCSRSQMRTRD